MLISDNIFIRGSVNDRSNLRKFEAECRYSLFSKNHKCFYAFEE